MKIIIFGNREMAEIANFYYNFDKNEKVAAFTVNGNYLKESNFCGLPVIPFEEIEKNFDNKEYLISAPIYPSDMNVSREKIYYEIKNKGYNFYSYISTKSYIWNAEIGENAFILEGCNIQPFCKIGKNFMMWSFSHIGHHSVIDDNVFVSGHVVVAGHNKIGKNCFLGTNCSTKNDISIDDFSFIGQHSSITKNLNPNNGFWVGCPAKRIKEI